MMSLFRSVIKTSTIEFLCDNDDFGVIPEPFPARKLMPEWFKHLPPKIEKKDKLNNSTIKRCAPFLDAMTIGWIIPLAADVEIITNADASGVDYKWNYHKTMVENHSTQQITTESSPHPATPKPPLKFLNYWMIKVPKDYSCLFIPPMNRADSRFECIAGLVDVDGYFEYINFPFFFKTPNYTGILKAGTPLVQVIPIKRDTLISDSNARILTDDEIEERSQTRRKKASHESHYRDNVWARK